MFGDTNIRIVDYLLLSIVNWPVCLQDRGWRRAAVKPKDLIREVNKPTGNRKFYPYVPKSGKMYVLTFNDKAVTDFVSNGVQCGGRCFNEIQ